MAFELIASIVAAVALAGVALILRKMLPGVMPKWSVPVAAGLGLVGFTVWSEYDWFARVSAELPEGVEVVLAQTEAQPLRPWTYLAPITTRFVAMDLRALARHPERPDLVMAKLYNFGRWQPVKDALMILDCGARRQVLVTEGVSVTSDGTLVGAEWQVVGAEDGFQQAACREG